MEDRRRSIGKLFVIVSIILIIVVGMGLIFSRTSTLSPLPEESAIKIIFITPTATILPNITP